MRIIRHLTIGLTVLTALAGRAQTYSGDGTEASPYRISTPAEFNAFAAAVTAGEAYAGKFFQLTADLTFTEALPAAQVGDGSRLNDIKGFGGVFDGNGHSMAGVKMESSQLSGGLFSYILAGGTLKNLTLTSPSMTTSGGSSGIIVGQSKGTIDNCHVKNGVLTSTLDNAFKGGIAGKQQSGVIRNCTFTGSITTMSSAGCIVGQSWSGTIENCHASGTLVSNTSAMGGSTTQVHLGGIAGVVVINPGYMKGCWFEGSVIGSDGNNVGALVGSFANATMEQCWSAAYVSGKNNGNTGGLVGSLGTANISDSYSASTVYNVTSATVGGIAGYTSNADTLTNVIAYGSLFNSPSLHGEGCEFAGNTNSKLVIRNSYFDQQVGGYGLTTGNLTTRALTTGTPIEGFSTDIWTFHNGLYPRLKASAQTDAAILYAVPVYYAEGQVQSRVYSDFTLGQYGDVEWELSPSPYASLSGNTVKVRRSEELQEVTLTAYLGEYTRRQLFQIYPTMFAGSGTESDPYLIASYADLQKLSKATNEKGMSFAGEYFRQTAPITMEAGYEPIGVFSGCYDGNRHPVSSMTFTGQTGKVMNMALFREVTPGGTVKNVVVAPTSGLKVSRNFATIVLNLNGRLENCVNNASFVAENYVGAMVYTMSATGRITDCVNNGSVTLTGNGCAGGLVYSCSGGSIEGCVNTGAITSSDAASKTIGGIAGTVTGTGTLTDCANYGYIAGGENIGGMAGNLAGTGAMTNLLGVGVAHSVSTNVNVNSLFGNYTGTHTCTGLVIDSQIAVSGGSQANEALLTSQLVDPATPLFGGSTAWTRAAGKYPVPSCAAADATVEFYRNALLLPSSETREELRKDLTLPLYATWTLASGEKFRIQDGKLIVSGIEEMASDVLTGYSGTCRVVLPIATMGRFLEGDGTPDSPWLIRTPADFNRLATTVNDTHKAMDGKVFMVTADLDFTDVALIPVATALPAFEGTFIGQGHVFKGVRLQGTADYTGIFGRLGRSASVSGIVVDENSSVTSSKKYTGTIAGLSHGTITDCRSAATVSSTDNYVGGITGYSGNNADPSAIHRCVNTGKVDGKAYVGGIAGYGDGLSSFYALENTGTVTATSYDAGGVIGYTRYTVTADSIVNRGDVSGTYEVGGLIGNAYKSGSKYTTLTRSANSGNVTGSRYNIGGLIGKADATVITDCINIGAVTNTAATVGTSYAGAGGIVGHGVPELTNVMNAGAVSAPDRVGGLLGFPSSTYTAYTFTNTYNTGKVTAADNATMAGAIQGKESAKGVFVNVAYDSETSGQYKAMADNEVTGVTALPTLSFLNRDFGTGWLTSAASYPWLAALPDEPINYQGTAMVVFANGDRPEAVTREFRVSKRALDHWTIEGTDAITIRSNGIAHYSRDYVGQATLSNGFRTWQLTLNIHAGATLTEADEAVILTPEGITVRTGVAYMVFGIDGRMIASGTGDGRPLPLPAGTVIVAAGGKAHTFIIR